MKSSIFVACFILMMLGTTPDAFACSCARPSDPQTALTRADAVFNGRVASIQRLEMDGYAQLLVKFDIDTSWKGETEDQVFVMTADNSAACGYYFKKGEAYLVYSYLYEGVLHTNICTRTSLLENATEDLRELGKGEDIIRSGRCGGPTNVAAMQTFLFLLMGIGLMRRKSNSFQSGKLA